MFEQKEWTFTGASGAARTFTLSPKSEELPAVPGVFILAYTHPRGHRAGWQVTVLNIRYCEDIRAGVRAEAGRSCLQKGNWNCNYYHIEPDEQAGRRQARDLVRAYDPPC